MSSADCRDEVDAHEEMLSRDLQQRTNDIEQQMLRRAREQLEQKERLLKRLGRSSLADKQSKELTEARSSDHQHMSLWSIMNERNQIFTQKQEEMVIRMKHLRLEREQLHQEQQKLKMLQTVLPPISPSGRVLSNLDKMSSKRTGTTASSQSVCSMESFVRRIKKQIPENKEKIQVLRTCLRLESEKTRPYLGELGPQSYQPEQRRAYNMARSILEELIEKFLFTIIGSDYSHLDQDTLVAMKVDEQEGWIFKQQLSTDYVTQLISEGILLEMTAMCTEETVTEVLYFYHAMVNRTSLCLIRQVETIAMGEEAGREITDSIHAIVSQGYKELKSDRKKFRQDAWLHTQSVVPLEKLKNAKKELGDLSLIKEESDITVLEFHNLTPMDLKNTEPSQYQPPEVKSKKHRFYNFINKEPKYWQGVASNVFTFDLSRKCQGISTARPSHDHSFLAVGTFHGDIIVYNLSLKPWKPAAAICNNNSVHDAVVHIAWSLDASRILSINKMGTLFIWEHGDEEIKSDASDLRLPLDNSGYSARQLNLLLSLDVDENDFMFQEGPFASQKVTDKCYRPLLAEFFPELTLLSTQHSFCVALENGDILKCSMENISSKGPQGFCAVPKILNGNSLHNVDVVNENLNLIGQGVSAELLRFHKFPVVSMGFVNNIQHMVSVDSKAFISIWKFERLTVSNYGWFVPYHRYWLDMSKMMYIPVPSAKSQVVFDDKKCNGMSQKQLTTERLKVTQTISRLQLGDPWHEDYRPDRDLVAPVSKNGSIFHIITLYSNSDLLAFYENKLYEPVKVHSAKLLCVIFAPGSAQLVFALLFSAYPPKGPHISILILDLATMTLKDYRRDIYLKAEEYNECLHSNSLTCDVSRNFGPTGTEYLFIGFRGILRVISLTSGRLVLKTMDHFHFSASDFPGCYVSSEVFGMPVGGSLTVLCTLGHIYCAAYGKKCKSLQVLELVDIHSDEDRLKMWNYTKPLLVGHTRVPPELRVDPVQWYLHTHQHPGVYMRKLVLECMDAALQTKVEKNRA